MLPALGVSWDVLQGVEGVATPWGWESLLGGGKEQVLSWKWGQWVSAAVSLCSKRSLGRLKEGKKPWCVQAVLQSEGLGWRQSLWHLILPGFGDPSLGIPGFQGVSDSC